MSEQASSILILMVFLLTGWFFALFVRGIFKRILKWMKVELIAEKLGIEDFLLNGGIRFTATSILSNVAFWSVFFIVLLTGLNFVGLSVASDLVNQILAYIPKLLTSFILLLFGILVARSVRSILSAYLNNLKVSGAQIIAKVAQFTIVVLVICIIMEHLNLGGQILLLTFGMAFGALCLAVGLAFGWAGRQKAAEIVERIFKD